MCSEVFSCCCIASFPGGLKTSSTSCHFQHCRIVQMWSAGSTSCVLIWSSLSLPTACMVSCSLKQCEQSVIVWMLNKWHLNDRAWTPVYLSGWASDCSWSNLQRRFMSFYMSFFRMPDDVLAHIYAVHQLPINLLLQTGVCCLSQVLFIHVSFFVCF